MLKKFSKLLWRGFPRKDSHISSVINAAPPADFFFLSPSRPAGSIDEPFKALVFDSSFDHYRGVVANVAVFGGRVKKGDKIVSAHLRKTYEVNEVGLLRPDEFPTQKL